jgi:hypothetical protein
VERFAEWVAPWALIAAFGGGILLCMLLLALHLLWPARLRDAAIREPYFSPTELAIGSAFPLSLWYTLALAGLLVYPQLMRRRFGELEVRELSGQPWIALSHLLLVVLVIAASGWLLVFVLGLRLLAWDASLLSRMLVRSLLVGALIGAVVWRARKLSAPRVRHKRRNGGSLRR